jgi:class 3 adenylate cyclase
MYAATYPERVTALAFWNAWAKALPSSDYPFGIPQDVWDRSEALVAEGWGLEERTAEIVIGSGAPSLAADPETVRWAAKACRYMGSPGDVLAFDRMYAEIDFRAICSSIHVPTVCIFTDDPDDPAEDCADLAARIHGAKIVRLPPVDDFPPWPSSIEPAVHALRDFVQGIRDEEAELDRVLATVLFTDIVDSTATAAVMGDAKWRKLIDEHDRTAKAVVSRYRGEYVESTGDGMLATFDGPARAVRCAQALGQAVKALGVEIRAGAHTGEITRSETGVAGLGVHVAARVASMGGANEVWTSSTVKDLTAGSGLVFEDAGEHELKGVPDRWRLYRVVG